MVNDAGAAVAVVDNDIAEDVPLPDSCFLVYFTNLSVVVESVLHFSNGLAVEKGKTMDVSSDTTPAFAPPIATMKPLC